MTDAERAVIDAAKEVIKAYYEDPESNLSVYKAMANLSEALAALRTEEMGKE